MAIVRVQASLVRDTLLPEDVSTNTWHCSTSDDVPANILTDTAAFIADLDTFYDSVGDILGEGMTGAGEFRAYNLADPEPRVPILITAFAYIPGTNQFPGEVAIVGSFHADIGSGDIAARKRNRVYIGPVASTKGGIVTGGNRPAAATVTQLRDALAALLVASNGSAAYTWQTFSPTNAGPKNPDGTYANLTAGIDPVTGGWVDNAWDTQRRRGLATTSRSTFG